MTDNMPDISMFQVAGFQLGHLLLAFVLSSSFVFLLYWLWAWPCGEPEESGAGKIAGKTILPRQQVKPIYALELEPGIVVLQSEDGEFFRVLREYESVGKRGHGTTAQDFPMAGSGPGCGGGYPPGYNHFYLPNCTEARYQTQPQMTPPPPLIPTGPLLGQPIPNSPFGDGAPWKPIVTLDKDSP